MSDHLRGVIFTHSELSNALAAAVKFITGVDDAVIPLSNDGLGRDGLCDAVTELIQDSPTVVFVDMPGGSCYQAVRSVTRDRPDVAMVTGVNLPMLLDFVFNLDATPAEAADRAARTGVQAIRTMGK